MAVAEPPPPPTLLNTLLEHILFTRYLQYFRHVGTSYEASKSTCRVCKLELQILDLLFGWGGGEGGDDDDIVSQIPRAISPEDPFFLAFTVLS